LNLKIDAKAVERAKVEEGDFYHPESGGID